MKTDGVDLTVGANRGLGKLGAASLVARFVPEGYAAAREAWAPIRWYFSWAEIVVLVPLAIGATVASSAREAIILFDNAGVGLSNGDAPTTVEGAAKDAETFVDALGELHFADPDWVSGRVDLLEFSLGGFVAQQLALSRPDVIDRVVLAARTMRTCSLIATRRLIARLPRDKLRASRRNEPVPCSSGPSVL
jgi:pimeloyl-ACP methyl ester carboxylesterase